MCVLSEARPHSDQWIWFDGFFFVSILWGKTETKVLVGFLVTQ